MMLFSPPYVPPPKERVTDQQALQLIVALPAYASYLDSQATLDNQSKLIRWDKNFAKKYQTARQKFDSDIEFAKSTNKGDQKLIIAAMKPFERARFERDKQITLIWEALQYRYYLSEVDISRIFFADSRVNTEATGEAENQNADIFMHWIHTGFDGGLWLGGWSDYGFALIAADFVHLSALNKCGQQEWIK